MCSAVEMGRLVAGSENKCAFCDVTWNECSCKDSFRTDSIDSILGNSTLFPDPLRRHLCVFVYHPYLRSVERRDLRDMANYSPACIPPWEGWYAGWLRIENRFPEIIPWTQETVLHCTLYYATGLSVKGYVDSQGRLFLNIPGPSPPGSTDYDSDRLIQRCRVDISQALSLREIDSATRGTVHGAVSAGRRASHILGTTKNGAAAVVALLPITGGAQGEGENAQNQLRCEETAVKIVEQFAPYMLNEYNCRRKRTFQKEKREAVRDFLQKLFERARLNDEAARYALNRSWNESRRFLPAVVQKAAASIESATQICTELRVNASSFGHHVIDEQSPTSPRARMPEGNSPIVL